MAGPTAAPVDTLAKVKTDLTSYFKSGGDVPNMPKELLDRAVRQNMSTPELNYMEAEARQIASTAPPVVKTAGASAPAPATGIRPVPALAPAVSTAGQTGAETRSVLDPVGGDINTPPPTGEGKAGELVNELGGINANAYIPSVGSTATPITNPKLIGPEADTMGATPTGGPGKAIDYMKQADRNTWGKLLLGFAGDALDVLGSGNLAFAGVQSPTRLQQEYTMRLASQEAANKAFADLDANLKMINPNASAEVRKLIAQGNANTAMNVAMQFASLEGELQKIDKNLAAEIHRLMADKMYSAAADLAEKYKLGPITAYLRWLDNQINLGNLANPAGAKTSSYASGLIGGSNPSQGVRP